jgi:hypothetical protein
MLNAIGYSFTKDTNFCKTAGTAASTTTTPTRLKSGQELEIYKKVPVTPNMPVISELITQLAPAMV